MSEYTNRQLASIRVVKVAINREKCQIYVGCMSFICHFYVTNQFCNYLKYNKITSIYVICHQILELLITFFLFFDVFQMKIECFSHFFCLFCNFLENQNSTGTSISKKTSTHPTSDIPQEMTPKSVNNHYFCIQNPLLRDGYNAGINKNNKIFSSQ